MLDELAPEELTSKIDALVVKRLTPQARAHAADVVRFNARDIDDAELLLQALGLMPYAANLTGHKPPDRSGMGRRYAACGTAPGAQVHHRAGEPLCPVCQAWSDERHRRSRLEPGSRCGTRCGAQMHRNLGERICEACAVAENKAAKERRETLRPGDPWDRDRSRARAQARREQQRGGIRLLPAEAEVLAATPERLVTRVNRRAPWRLGERSVTEAVKGLAARRLVWFAADDEGREYVVPTALGEQLLGEEAGS